MCGRFNVTSDPMTSLFMDLVGEAFPGEDNHNASPMSKAWIIRPERDAQPHEDYSLEAANAQWWLIPSWAKERSSKYSMFNARSETLRKSPAFRGPFKSRRCLVPISGFYEWVNRNGIKQPYYISDGVQAGMLLAGIWDRWWESEGVFLDSFAIVTTAVVPDLKFIHHRQPVILDRERAMEWVNLSTESSRLAELCQPQLPYDLSVKPVSEYVNSTRNKGPGCLEVIGDEIRVSATG